MRPERSAILAGTAILAAAIIASGCERKTATEATAQPPAAVAVSAAPVRTQDEPVTLEATGSFEADESSDVAPDSSGRVVATPVDVGQFVKSGAVLVRLQGVDAGLRLDEARAAVTRAEASVKLAESQNTLAQTTAQRYASLLATGDVSSTVADQARTTAETSVQNVNTARASLAQARAQLALAEKAVADVAVIAPFSGFISERKVSLGEYVQPSTAVVTLLKIDPLRLRLTIPGVQAGQIRVGQSVTATVDAFPEQSFSGRITAVNPAISAQARSFIVEARVPNPDAILKPGMFAVATIDQGRTVKTMLVPRRAVIEDANTNSYRVFVIDKENRARLRVVQLAARDAGDNIRIVSGIQAGDRVATSNLAQLYDGAEVRVGS
ncbi:MAG TPA: efflux RND transporter periplasmic adaptor subunit [Vicinamibacterales bacterium]|nr:efflux RND transporter periplasmic adaptor subunit [Vicinamibacterales bacterium]